jgi:hypothetical protein
VDSLGERGGDKMKVRKDLVLAVLATFCLTVTLFSLVPVRSSLPYSPWSDTFDENGKIDMKDIGNIAAQFGTTGDPTKNVNVMNWPPEFDNVPTYVNISWNPTGFVHSIEGCFFSTNGYAKMSIFITPTNTSSGDWGSKLLTIRINTFSWYILPMPSTSTGYSVEYVDDYNTTLVHYPSSFLIGDAMDARVFDVKGPTCLVGIHPQWSGDGLPPTAFLEGWITLQINWYLRND